MSGQQDDNLHVLSDPDPKIIRAHLERFFRRVPSEYPGGMMELAWSETTGAIRYAEWFQCTPEGIEQAVKLAVGKNKEGRNVYVGVNPRRPGVMPGGRSNTADIEIAFFQFVECDKNESNDLLTRASLPCSFSVTTGRTPHRRPHCYWELEDPVRNMDAWKAQQAALRDYFLGDNMTDPPRLMRLAGTINYPAAHKRARGYKQELVTLKTIYGNEERPPVTSQSLAAHYMRGRPQEPRYDQETGEVFDASTGQPGGIHSLKPKGVNADQLLRDIKRGVPGWHDMTRDLTAHYVGIGLSDELIISLADACTWPGYTLEDTRKYLRTEINGARKKWHIPNPDSGIVETSELSLPFIGVLKPSDRGPREWLVPFRMMRKHITLTGAAPGVGKTNLAIEEAISMASGIDFLDFGIKETRRVAVINNEETRDELERRIEATCQHFSVPLESIANTLAVYSGVDAEKIVLARLDKNKNVFPTVNTHKLKEIVNDQKFDLVILDPFVQLHYVTENVPEEISKAMVQIRTIGLSEYPAAVHLIHHNRKPVAGTSHQAGDINALRGGSSMGGEAHFVFTLTDMGNSDGENLNVSEDERSLYVRMDDAKGKMSPPQGAQWYKRHGVMMPYGLMGEEIGVLIPYDFGDERAVTKDNATRMLQIIQEAWNNETPYNSSHQSGSRYVIPVIMKELKMTRSLAKGLLKDWEINGMVATELCVQHKHLRGLRVLKWPG